MDGFFKDQARGAMARASRRGRRPSRTFQPSSLGMERFEERTLLSVALVSVNAAGTASGNSDSSFVDPYALDLGSPTAGKSSISADGKSLVFQSDATDLVDGVYDSNKATDVYVRDLQTGKTQLVSATPDGKLGNGRSYQPIISPDGRYVAFLSQATNLSGVTGNDPNADSGSSVSNLYVRDLVTQKTTLLDATPDGAASNGFATGTFAFSPDGSTLAFTDSSTNLTSTPPSAATAPPSGFDYGPPSFNDNVYLRNLAAGTTTAVSVTPQGTLSHGNVSGYGGISDLVFSPDGKRLAFSSTATDLTDDAQDNTPGPGPWNGGGPVSNVFVRDLTSQTTSLVSITSDGHVSNGN